MSRDEMLQHAYFTHLFLAWFAGIIATVALGLILPVTLSVVVDAVALGRRRGDWKALRVVVGLSALFLVVGGWEMSNTTAAGAPSVVMWSSLALVLFSVALLAAFGLAIERVVRRRHQDRAAWNRLAPSTLDSGVDHSGPLRVAPAPRRRLNFREAEVLAAEWMRFHGLEDAVVTPPRRDGGVDVRSAEHVAQVKLRMHDLVGVEDLRAFDAAKAMECRSGLFFTTRGYTKDALAWAREAHIALFIMRYREGELKAANSLAHEFLNVRGGVPRSRHSDLGAR